MDALVIILIIIILVLLFKRTFSSAIYAVCIVDIFLRIVDFIKDQVPALRSVLGAIPGSLNEIIIRYTSGIPIIELILLWLIFVVYVIFEFYIFRIFLKKK